MSTAEYANITYVFVTLLAMVNPLEAAGAYAALMEGRPVADRLAIAKKSALAGLVILVGFGLIGDALLGALGISLDAFKVAGGMLLFAVGFNMVFAQQTDTDTAAKEGATPRTDPSIFPLGIPILTGPGALTASVSLFGRAHAHPHPVAYSVLVIVIAVVVFGITYVAMVGSNQLQRVLGTSGIEALSRIVGIVVAAIAVQLVIDGALDVIEPLLHRAG